MNFTFDWNEWFILIWIAILFSLYLLVHKFFHPVTIVVIWVFSNVYVATIDYFLLATPFKLYYFGDNTTYEPFAALFHILIYPSGSFILLFIYEKWELYGKKTVWYILAWTAFSVFFEWLCLKSGVLTYKGWKLIYSIPTYPPSAILLITLYHFTNKKLEELSLQKLPPK